MAIQFSVNVRNGRLDALETVIGASAVLKIRTGAPPANCAAADSGTELVSMALPANWMNDAASGSKTMAGTWAGVAGSTGIAGHFRIYNNGATVCHIQGTCSMPAGGGDMILDNTSIANNQNVAVSTFTITDGNA